MGVFFDLVALSGLSSNYSIFPKLCKLKEELVNLPEVPVKSQNTERARVNECGKTEIKRICQKQKILSKNEVEEIKSLYLNGVPSGALATAFGCHRTTICNTLKRAKITVDQHIEGRKYKTEEVIRLYQEEKVPIKEIAKKFGVCEGSIYKCLKRNNIDTKRTRWDYKII